MHFLSATNDQAQIRKRLKYALFDSDFTGFDEFIVEEEL